MVKMGIGERIRIMEIYVVDRWKKRCRQQRNTKKRKEEERDVQRFVPPLRLGNFLICLPAPGGGVGAAPIVNNVPPTGGGGAAPPALNGNVDCAACPNPPPAPLPNPPGVGGCGRLELPAAGDAGWLDPNENALVAGGAGGANENADGCWNVEGLLGAEPGWLNMLLLPPPPLLLLFEGPPNANVGPGPVADVGVDRNENELAVDCLGGSLSAALFCPNENAELDVCGWPNPPNGLFSSGLSFAAPNGFALGAVNENGEAPELGTDALPLAWPNIDPVGLNEKSPPTPPSVGLSSTGLLLPFNCMSLVGLSSILISCSWF